MIFKSKPNKLISGDFCFFGSSVHPQNPYSPVICNPRINIDGCVFNLERNIYVHVLEHCVTFLYVGVKHCVVLITLRPMKSGSNTTGRGVMSLSGLSYGVVRVEEPGTMTSLTLQDVGLVMPGGV